LELANIASLEINEISADIVAASTLLVDLLRGGSEEGKVQAAEVLGNPAGSMDANRAAVVEAGAIPPLVDLLRGGSMWLIKRNAAMALRSLADGNDTNKVAIVEAGTLNLRVEMLRAGGLMSEEVRNCAAGALGNLAGGDGATIPAIVEAGALPLLVALLRGGTEEGKQHVAGALYNLTFHDAGLRQAEGLGYTRDRLRELHHAGRSSPENSRWWQSDM
jgi:vacuolar protein 8